MKNGTTCEELLSWRPWAASIADILTEIARTTAVLDTPETPGTSHASALVGSAASHAHEAEGEGPSWATSPSVLATVSDETTRQAIERAADRLARRLVSISVEPSSQQGIADLVKECPLANVKATSDTGNVIVLVDCNAYGETDVQPEIRPCPMSPDIFKKWIRGVLQGRYGSAEPAALREGDIFLCIDGGRDRKRIFMKGLTNAKTGKDPERIVCQALVMSMRMAERS